MYHALFYELLTFIIMELPLVNFIYDKKIECFKSEIEKFKFIASK